MSEIWKRRIDKAWLNKDLRREFEVETGLASLAWFFDSDKKERQVQSGHAFAYEHCFKAWASKKLNIQEVAPEETQEFFFLSEAAAAPIKVGR